MKRILIGSFIFILFSSLVLATPPVDLCEESGGTTYEYQCQCPENTTLLWKQCWKRTPKETCEELGGEETSENGTGSLSGSDFKCVKEEDNKTIDITEKAREYSVNANEELIDISEKENGENETTEGSEDGGDGLGSSLILYIILGIIAVLAGTIVGRLISNRGK